MTHDVLVRCLGITTDCVAEHLRELSPSDWDQIAEEAERLAISPLLYLRLRKAASELSVAKTALQRLRATYQLNALRNMQLYRSLYSVLRALHQQDIPVIVLKGAHLAQAIYKDIALRTMGDVDILVNEAHAPRVEKVLLELGYRFHDGKFQHERVQDGKQAEQKPYHTPYVLATDETITVEVHWHIEAAHSPFQVDVAGLWQRAHPARIAGIEVLVLAPEDLLLHLCIHNAHHHIFGHYSLRALCDIREVIEHFEDALDWEQVCHRCRAWGSDHSVYLTLRLAQELLNAAVPAGVLDSLRPASFDVRMIGWAQDRIFSQVDDKAGPWSNRIGRLRSATRLAERVRILLHTCFPPLSELAARYSVSPRTPWLFLYYPVRLRDLLLHHSRTVLGLVRRDTETVAWTQREAGRTALMKWLYTVPPSRARTNFPFTTKF